MKKLKKLNIIEAGRTCSPEEMKEIVGGYMECSGGVGLSVCLSDILYFSCEQAAAGFYSGSCKPDILQSLDVCSEGYKYSICIVMKETCSEEISYVQ